MCVTHSETSTGVHQPDGQEIAAVPFARSPRTRWSCSSIAVTQPGWCAELRLRRAGESTWRWPRTQKCLALPGGFTVYAISERALERSRAAEGKGWLLDFVRATDGLAAGKSVATPSIPHLFALELQLSRIASEGLENRFARHTAMAERTRAWAAGHGLSMFSPDGYHSPTVSTIRTGDIDVAALNKQLAERGLEISNGYGKLKGITMRIGHMGDHTLEGLDELLRTIDECLG